ncbi:hypothetical protein D8674_013487 [Pyrus ussuriensis x Pyrus communis]|uniref:UDP-glycosyltransferase 74F2-like n=1 Tax=Pyrus ussuriensis x Pyrus communis TaxID=2448454 RepID=A0A5N5GQS7_9ROSA|nr:hypothetical protein D8674_013487 [Pyrus ussuriensis x Pyrus communis]
MHKSSSSESSFFALETISDGYDQGGSAHTQSVEAYLDRFWQRLSTTDCPVDCIVYDSFMPWPLDVAKKIGIVGAVFFTHSCAVGNIYYRVHRGLLKLPLSDQSQILVPGLPPLEPWDMPSFFYDIGSYPAVNNMVVSQFSNVDKADWVLRNTFFELEEQIAKFLPLRTIGQNIPSYYLDKQLENNKEYGVNLFKSNNDVCMKWLDEQLKGFVAYMAFGSA